MAKLTMIRFTAVVLAAAVLLGCGEKVDPNDPSLKTNIKSKPGVAGGAKPGAAGAGRVD